MHEAFKTGVEKSGGRVYPAYSQKAYDLKYRMELTVGGPDFGSTK